MPFCLPTLRVMAWFLMFMSVLGFIQAADTRYQELVRVINRNTGYAHMTRGVSMFTLYALRSCVTSADIPVMERMLTDKDRVVRRAAASVLADLGPDGTIPILRRLQATTTVEDRMLLEEAITDAGTRPAILSYPLSAADRKRLRGCTPRNP